MIEVGCESVKTRIACKYCIATKGLKGSELEKQTFGTQEEFVEHIEMVHDIPVTRKGETEKETMDRFSKKNPRAGGPDCQCPACQAKHGHVQVALLDSFLKAVNT